MLIYKNRLCSIWIENKSFMKEAIQSFKRAYPGCYSPISQPKKGQVVSSCFTCQRVMKEKREQGKSLIEGEVANLLDGDAARQC